MTLTDTYTADPRSATRPYLARLVTTEGNARTDRPEYLYQHFIEPIRSRFLPVFQQLQEQGRIKNISPDVFYFLLTSASLMNPAMVSPDRNSTQVYAENVAEILINGLSLPGH